MNAQAGLHLCYSHTAVWFFRIVAHIIVQFSVKTDGSCMVASHVLYSVDRLDASALHYNLS